MAPLLPESCNNLLYSTLILHVSTLLYSTLFYSTLLYSNLLYSKLIYTILPDSTLFHFSLLWELFICDCTLLCSLLFYYSPVTSLQTTLLLGLKCTPLYYYYIQFYSTLLYSAPLFASLLYLFSSFLLYSTLFYSSLLFSTLHFSSLLYSTLLYSKVHLHSSLRFATLL